MQAVEDIEMNDTQGFTLFSNQPVSITSLPKLFFQRLPNIT